MKKNLSKGMPGIILCFVLLLGMSLTALAESDSVASVNSQEYVNFDQAVRYWNELGDGATLKLLKDVNTAEAISVSGKKTLDLNGHSFTGNVNVTSSNPSVTDACFTIKDSGKSGSIGGALTVSGAKAAMESGSIKGGVQIQNAGEFTLTGGTISGCTSNGVDIKNGTFTMSSGTIKDNTGAGVALSAKNPDSATFTMSGGEITGNTTGVLVSENDSSNPGGNVFKLNGSPRILGNGSKDVACNVKLEGDALIHIIGQLQRPVGVDEPQIGVTKPIIGTDLVFTKDYNTHNPGVDPAIFFKYDTATAKSAIGLIGSVYVCWHGGENDNGTGPSADYSSNYGEAARCLHTHVWEPFYQYAFSIDENFRCTSRHQENLFTSRCFNAITHIAVLKHGICPYCTSCTLTLNVQSKKYDGVPVVATLTPSEGWMAEKPCDYDASKIDYFKKDGTALPGAPKDVGDYVAKYKLDVDGSYTPGEMTKYDCISTSFKIEKADVSITAPMARELTYDGSKQELVTAGSTSNGTLYYAVTTNSTAPDASLYTTSIPTATDVGTYYVWYKVKGDDKYNDTEAASVKVTIAKVKTNNGTNNNSRRIKDRNNISKKPKIPSDSFLLNSGIWGSQTGSSVTLKWGRTPDADMYKIYGGYCGKEKVTYQMTIKGNKKTKSIIKKLNRKKINTRKVLKFRVCSYKKVKGKLVETGRSIIIHFPGRKNSYTSIRAVKLAKTKYTLKKGDTVRIKPKQLLMKKEKKPLDKSHAPRYRYSSSNPAVVKVNKNGKMRTLKSGTCTVYVFAVNGCKKKITVKVK